MSQAQQALMQYCAPLLTHTRTSPGSSTRRDAATAPDTALQAVQQISLYKPCAWPFAVTAAHFASSSKTATLARDAALWECLCVELLARQLAVLAPDAQLHARISAVAAQNPVLQSMLLASVQSRAELGEASGAQQVALSGVEPKEEELLCLLWHAAACFAERAGSRSAEDRALWSSLTAQSLQARFLSLKPLHTVHIHMHIASHCALQGRSGSLLVASCVCASLHCPTSDFTLMRNSRLLSGLTCSPVSFCPFCRRLQVPWAPMPQSPHSLQQALQTPSRLSWHSLLLHT